MDLLLAIPRPSRLTQLLPVISALGVDRLILLGAERVERAYFGSRLVCEDKDRRTLLTNGLMQCCVDYHLPELLVEKSLGRFLQYSNILSTYDANEHEETIRIIAHPPYSDVGIEARSSRTSFRSLMQEVTASPTKAPRRVVVAIGPEGGWLPSEVCCSRIPNLRHRKSRSAHRYCRSSTSGPGTRADTLKTLRAIRNTTKQYNLTRYPAISAKIGSGQNGSGV